jgi:formylglycine-generating enzyme required for sulfatase activity/tRNA A-37 threonylcarbamoyl transferase component Bud32
MEVRPGVSAPKGNSEPAARDLAPGEKLGRYAILESVGRGAMGVVYAAYDSELDRKIALKVLNPNRARASPVAPARLVREAKAMARLAHPNVIAIHDVGEFEGQVFLAMEFLGGGTLRTWLDARPRAWRECLDLFLAAGRGLAAAHEAGLVHRDFKPDNVLLDKQQRPRVVDFGLAREAAAGDDETRETALEVSQITETSRAAGGHHLETLTRTGTLVGTPAYMAPEQFLGELADERSDQFSFCVALYEALFGARPFAGDNVLSLSLNVTSGNVRPVPKDRVVPTWIRRVIARGLQSKPADRYPTMAALIAALEDDPAARRRRRLITGGVVAVVVASLLVAGQMVRRRRQELERQIAAHLAQATESATRARAQAAEARRLREQALTAFDAMERERGEGVWRQALTQVPAAEATFDRAARALESALVLDSGRADVRGQLAAVLEEQLQLAQVFLRQDRARALEGRLLAQDADGSRARRLRAPGTLVLAVKPEGGRATLVRYERDPASGRRVAQPVKDFAPAASAPLPAGSYRLALAASGHEDVAYPFEVRPGQRVVVDVTLPPAGAVPAGFVYVPAGEFWYGDADEQLRTQFLDTAPLHRRSTGAFLIARHETTFREWITFLDSLPPARRDRLSPDVSVSTRGSMRLSYGAGGWQLAFQPTTQRYEARQGEPIVYQGRKLRARQDWLEFPATGMSPQDAEQYLAWLRSSGRVPRARLCTELEWERAARGADDRLFPHGDELHADDANFDVTYGRVPAAYGPDVVGAHPLSTSPFGVQDLAGNALELALSAEKKNDFVIRSGAYYFGTATARSNNRSPIPSTFRDVAAGLRVCASALDLNGGH